MLSFYAYFVVSAEQAVGQTVELPVIWAIMMLVWRHCNDLCNAKMEYSISRRIIIFVFADWNLNILGP